MLLINNTVSVTCDDGDKHSKSPPTRLLARKQLNCRKQARRHSLASLEETSIQVRVATQIGHDLVNRYGPHPPQASLVSKLYALPSGQRSNFRQIKTAWHKEWATLHPTDPQPWSDESLLRVWNWVNFDKEQAMKVLRNMKPSHWHTSFHEVSANSLAKDFASRAVLPLPGISTKSCSNVIYIRPSRFFAVKDPLRLITYTMNCIYDRYGDSSSSCKMALLVNLKGYHLTSRQQDKFGFADWVSLIQLVQGESGPIKAVQVFFVNAQFDFLELWDTHLQPFCKFGTLAQFYFADNANNLDIYFEPGFEDGLTKDLQQGKTSTRELISDFLTYRKALEKLLHEEHDAACKRKEAFVQKIRQDLQEQRSLQYENAEQPVSKSGRTSRRHSMLTGSMPSTPMRARRRGSALGLQHWRAQNQHSPKP